MSVYSMFNLHEYEGLKDQLFNLFLCWTAKKKYINTTKKNIVDQVKRKQIYIGKKVEKEGSKKKREVGGVQHNFYCNFICGLLIFTSNQSFS